MEIPVVDLSQHYNKLASGGREKEREVRERGREEGEGGKVRKEGG